MRHPWVKNWLSGPENLKYDQETIDTNVKWAIETVNMHEYHDSPPLALSYGAAETRQHRRYPLYAVSHPGDG